MRQLLSLSVPFLPLGKMSEPLSLAFLLKRMQCFRLRAEGAVSSSKAGLNIAQDVVCHCMLQTRCKMNTAGKDAAWHRLVYDYSRIRCGTGNGIYRVCCFVAIKAMLHLLFGSRTRSNQPVNVRHMCWSRHEQHPTVQAPCVQQAQKKRLRPNFLFKPPVILGIWQGPPQMGTQ